LWRGWPASRVIVVEVDEKTRIFSSHHLKPFLSNKYLQHCV